MPSKIVYVPDYTATASAVIDSDYILSSTSSGMYVSKEFNESDVTTAEVTVKCMQTATKSRSDVFSGWGIVGFVNGSLGVWTGSSWRTGTNYSAGNWVWVKAISTPATGTIQIYGILDNGYTLDTLPDISQWNLEYSGGISYGSPLASALYIPDSGSSEWFNGKVDLKEVQVKKNGEEIWRAVTAVEVDTSGSISISKGYYDSGSAKIMTGDITVSLPSLITGQTVGCKNNLFMTSSSGVVAPYLSSAEAPAGTFDVSVKLDTPVYLDWTKQYIAGSSTDNPEWSHSGGTTEDYTIVGSPTISSEHVASDFSASNYLTTNNSIDFSNASKWEFITKVTVGSTSTDQKIIYGSGINFGISSSGMCRIWLSSNGGSSWFINSDVKEGSYFDGKWIKLDFTGSQYRVWTSTDGSSWTYWKGLSSSTKVGPATVLEFGNHNGEYWRGSIDLTETYITMDGVEVWRAITENPQALTVSKALVYDSGSDKTFWYPQEATVTLSDVKAAQTVNMKNRLYCTNTTGSSIASHTFCVGTPAGVTEYYQQPEYVWLTSDWNTILGVQEEPDEIVVETAAEPVANYTVVGSPTVDSDWIASNFSSSGLVSKETVLDNSYETFEIRAKITTGSTSGNQIFFADTHSNACSVALNVNGGRFCLYLSSNGSSFDIAEGVNGSHTVSSGATYYVKLTFNGSSYVMSFSSDGVSFTDTVTINSTTKIATLTPTIGSWVRGGTTPDSSYFQGSVDLKEYSVLADGVEVWRAVSEGNITGVSVSEDHSWTWLLSSTYNAKGRSLEASSMSGTALSGSLMVMPSGVLAYSESNSQGSLMDAFTGYTVTFTDTTHASIASVTKTGTRCRTYYCEEQSSPTPIYRYIYVESLPATGALKTSTSGLLQREITPSETLSSYSYDSTTDTISYNGHTAIYAGDCYINL